MSEVSRCPSFCSANLKSTILDATVSFFCLLGLSSSSEDLDLMRKRQFAKKEGEEEPKGGDPKNTTLLFPPPEEEGWERENCTSISQGGENIGPAAEAGEERSGN